jgi:hypothetical protein
MPQREGKLQLRVKMIMIIMFDGILINQELQYLKLMLMKSPADYGV